MGHLLPRPVGRAIGLWKTGCHGLQAVDSKGKLEPNPSLGLSPSSDGVKTLGEFILSCFVTTS